VVLSRAHHNSSGKSALRTNKPTVKAASQFTAPEEDRDFEDKTGTSYEVLLRKQVPGACDSFRYEEEENSN
jgi:hypothetical protein